MTSLAAAEQTVPRIKTEQAVSFAEALALRIAPYVEEAGALRRMPAPVVEAFIQSGLVGLLRPRHYGGLESDWHTFGQLLKPIARVSGSMSWCFGFLLHHQWVLSYWPEAVQDENYAAAADPKIADAFAPGGKVIEVEGGYRISGEWPFASGVDHSDYALTGGLVMQENGPPRLVWTLLSPGQFRSKEYEMVVKIGGRRMYLWRAVDEDDEVLDVLAQTRRNNHAALKLLRKLLKNQGIHPETITTDKLASYQAALGELGLTAFHRPGGMRENNRAETPT